MQGRVGMVMRVRHIGVLVFWRSLRRETAMSFTKSTGVGNTGKQRKDPDEQHRSGKAPLR